jgi:hypothetical protein
VKALTIISSLFFSQRIVFTHKTSPFHYLPDWVVAYKTLEILVVSQRQIGQGILLKVVRCITSYSATSCQFVIHQTNIFSDQLLALL